MPTHPLIEQLIEQHIIFLEQQFLDTTYLQQEVCILCQWLGTQSVQNLVSLDQLQSTLRHLFIDTDIPQNTLKHLGIRLSEALKHPLNQTTTIADIVHPLHVDDLAQYTASKSTQRQYLIAHITKHPAFVNIATQLIQQVLHDYFQNHLNNNSSHVSRFMKIGKSVLENVTDLNLSHAIQQYLEKNVSKLAMLAEKTLNQQLSNDNVYELHVQMWHQLKNTPLSHLQHYIDANDLPHTIPLLHQFLDHFRHSPFFAQHLQQGLTAWYLDHENKSVLDVLHALGKTPEQVSQLLEQHLGQILQQFIHDGSFKIRLRQQLHDFYYTPSTLDLLKKI
ncbi:hypothetical protein I2F17_02530 [Acinetobacter sp. B10A]|uniref:hypothetical protein n=1 Tax=Acinetobacter baretiae TaxID=2605383 RepID=UPI001B3C7204|nr:hypothetical protein [Acinetobacter baretiae]MBF7684711.1 hypothetical protein [Acinetobacter baretiae]